MIFIAIININSVSVAKYYCREKQSREGWKWGCGMKLLFKIFYFYYFSQKYIYLLCNIMLWYMYTSWNELSNYLTYSSLSSVQFISVTQLCLTLCNPMNCRMPGLPVHHQLPEFTDSCPLSQRSHPAISSSVVPFSSCPQPLPASESFPRSQLFTWGGQSTGVSASASFLPKNTQGWSPLEFLILGPKQHPY